ncbi:MAG: rhomboid family intramembrane serine protease [Woeseiaceae bacterium]|nr:rhomboid family intramembrane serine protease [Woeseiaceae bacterium]
MKEGSKTLGKETNRGLDYWPKVQHIAPTYLVVGVLTVSGLIVIRWLFTQYLPNIEIKEDLWEYWIPVAFPILPIAIWLRPRVRILTFDSETDNRRFLILTIACISMTVPSVIAQEFVVRAFSELKEVESVFDISTSRPNRYYKIDDYEVADYLGGAHADVSVAGRTNSDMNFKFYFSFPISDTGDDIASDHSYWYGLVHHKRISNRLSDEEKERQYEKAYERGVEMVENHDFSDQMYFEVVQASVERDFYRRAVESRTGVSQEEGVVILVPGEGAFQHRTGERFDWIFLSSGIGIVVFLAFLFWPTYDVRELKRQRRGETPQGELLAGFKEFFVPRNDYFAAPILLDAIILVWLVQIITGVHPIYPDGRELLEWGANRRAETAGGEWWRLVTSMFLHGGFMHLMLNMYGLLLAAMFVEPIYGRVKLFVIFFVSGICGSLASIWWYENSISVGASGAIFGLFGAVFALAAMRVMRFQDLNWLWFFIGINLLFGLTGGIDNAAHLGGLFSGAIIGVLIQLVTKLPHEQSDLGG